jgi:hypothetical protein
MLVEFNKPLFQGQSQFEQGKTADLPSALHIDVLRIENNSRDVI